MIVYEKRYGVQVFQRKITPEFERAVLNIAKGFGKERDWKVLAYHKIVKNENVLARVKDVLRAHNKDTNKGMKIWKFKIDEMRVYDHEIRHPHYVSSTIPKIKRAWDDVYTSV